jgi:putative component of membrane protein insertase Oxa1/YidC/SpoIIIJ protein YidD
LSNRGRPDRDHPVGRCQLTLGRIGSLVDCWPQLRRIESCEPLLDRVEDLLPTQRRAAGFLDLDEQEETPVATPVE